MKVHAQRLQRTTVTASQSVIQQQFGGGGAVAQCRVLDLAGGTFARLVGIEYAGSLQRSRHFSGTVHTVPCGFATGAKESAVG